jgi:lysine 2,3-aminomutase
MEEWQKLLVNGVNNAKKLKELFPHLDEKQMKAVTEEYPVRINEYYLSLIESPDDPIAKQVIPEVDEVTHLTNGVKDDPLAEEDDAVVPGLTHRYPDRVLFYVNYQCPIYCRYCTRKRKIGDPSSLDQKNVKAGLDYIRKHKEVRDVILSGGDPLMLKDEVLGDLLAKLRAIKHVEIIRIGSRVPSTLPQRITPKLVETIKQYHPVYIMTHFSHPREMTPEVKKATDLLADNGFPMMNQTVLLSGVNDDPMVLKELFQKLLVNRVKPYYLYQGDLTAGAAHFRTSLKKGLEIMEAVRGHTSGLAVPYYVIDAPGGGGKIPVLPEYLLKSDENEVVLRNYEGKIFRYPLPENYEDEPVLAPTIRSRRKNGKTKKKTRRKVASPRNGKK